MEEEVQKGCDAWRRRDGSVDTTSMEEKEEMWHLMEMMMRCEHWEGEKDGPTRLG